MPGYINEQTNKPIPSVTEVIGCWKPNIDALLLWAANFGSKDKFKAGRYKGADEGKERHQRIEQFLRSESKEANHPSFSAYYRTLRPRLTGVEVEAKIVHPTRNFGGTIDLIAHTAPGLEIIDWKHSRSYPKNSEAYRATYNAYWLQVSGYSLLLDEVRNTQPIKATVINLSKTDTSYHIVEFNKDQLEQGRNVFIKLLEVYQTLNERK